LEIKEIDDQGRIIIPIDWRKRNLKNSHKVIIKLKEDSMEIVPYYSPDLTKYFDSVEVDLKSNLSDWKKVRKELRKR
jgi:bifunctional DNA-binding transcriptional regulator/antitoxin component of YhaV-PrlF toxin-antitoxin module